MVTLASRRAIARADLFIKLASDCPADRRIEYEAFVEAAIVFARAAIHRFQNRHRRHPSWQAWWMSIAGNPAVDFFREQRDWVLKEAPPKIGQRVYVSGINLASPAYQPSRADEFYYFESDCVATATLSRHLQALNHLLNQAEHTFG